jgi:menaquinone-dependent protoporphyrinogen oxidase
MKILVGVASRHGATEEIARGIGDELQSALAGGPEPVVVDVLDIEKVGDLSGYDAVVIGSALYMGNWLRTARDFITAHSAALLDTQVWLFSSGPVGDEPQRSTQPAGVAKLLSLSGARQHQVFGGSLDKQRLTFGEKAIVRMVGTVEGDSRDWSEIGRWSAAIADELRLSEHTRVPAATTE